MTYDVLFKRLFQESLKLSFPRFISKEVVRDWKHWQPEVHTCETILIRIVIIVYKIPAKSTRSEGVYCRFIMDTDDTSGIYIDIHKYISKKYNWYQLDMNADRLA